MFRKSGSAHLSTTQDLEGQGLCWRGTCIYPSGRFVMDTVMEKWWGVREEDTPEYTLTRGLNEGIVDMAWLEVLCVPWIGTGGILQNRYVEALK